MGQTKKTSSSPAAQYFAEVLRLLRTAKALSQNELGDLMAYSGAAVSAVETCAKPATDEFSGASGARSAAPRPCGPSTSTCSPAPGVPTW
ncbi:helix-turn-helix domain-containing protein [Streptomyces blattellae]|uniref:helix-turn-helix domain-containing protein n=1 Tax=Streptomyces blattellae TaxID=2569855 RepID=UPI001E509EB1|nr:helix-turn-helix transcriptional regulator [Streptomyces blattellae]